MKTINLKTKKYSQYDGNVIELEITPNECKKETNIMIKLLAGIIIGFINGFFGGGGGMICVPILSQIVKLPDKRAHATTLLIMLPLSIASLIVYILKNQLPWMKILEVGGGFVVGGIVGACILKYINNFWLGVVFSVIIIAGGVKMVL